MHNSFYSEKELCSLGLKHYGSNVKISKKVSFYSPQKIKIGNNVRIDDFCILSGNITLGNYIHISASVLIFAGETPVVIGDFTAISSQSAIYAESDDYSGDFLTNPTIPNKYRNIIKGKVQIGKHCVFGTNSVILPGVTIGDGVSCGAMTLVNKDLKAWEIFVGSPARRLKSRSRTLLSLEKSFLQKSMEEEKEI